MLIYSSLALLLGFIMDLIIGDPCGWPHLARLMGALIGGLEKRLYCAQNKRRGGALLVIIVLTLCAAVPFILMRLLHTISPFLYLAAETVLCWQLLAVKSLRDESWRVCLKLRENDLPGAKSALSMIVGRDTDCLDEAGTIRAAVETVAENINDGVIAPMFYMALDGAALGCLYKSVNTMDSMLGYKNDRYIDFGRFAARLDDALNFIPSRLCAVLMLISCRPCGMSDKNALRIWRRDRRNHSSPNSGQTEAVMAGALGVRLAGDAVYGGLPCKKPYIGDDTREIETGDICRSHKLLYLASILMLLLSLAARGLFYAAI